MIEEYPTIKWDIYDCEVQVWVRRNTEEQRQKEGKLPPMSERHKVGCNENGIKPESRSRLD